MKNEWSDSIAEQYINKYQAKGVSSDVALRVYTSHLLGSVPALVTHGGGNTSVKTTEPDFLGKPTDVLCVKGSGWNLDTIEPEGLPALQLEPLQAVREWDKLSDEDMVSFQRSNLLKPSSPNPSVETLLHGFLPHKFVDHSHSTAILSLTNQANGEALCKKVFGDRVAIVPFVMPGFDLAKLTADIQADNPDVEGLVLIKHGLFTFGETAEQSYSRHINLVTIAEHAIAAAPDKDHKTQTLPKKLLTASQVAPLIRGACASHLGDGHYNRWVVRHRTSDAIRQYVDGANLTEYGLQGVITPDHIIRTKNKPLILPIPQLGLEDEFVAAIKLAVEAYQADYIAYFERNNARLNNSKTQLDPMPRVALVPGVGVFTIGKSVKEADIAADLFELSVGCVMDAERIGQYQALPEEDLFEMEYWSLEQAKLGKSKPLPLQGQVAVITGGGGMIGHATAKLFQQNGAEIAILDADADKLAASVGTLGKHALAILCDVNDSQSVDTAIAQVCEYFGGFDILISNAGAAWQGAIGDLSEADLRASFELNFFSHQRLAQAATRIFTAQDSGGCLLFNASKQAINPGKNFGAYGLPKAATLFLSRQYALEYGALGIRSNAVNADRIRSGLLDDEFIGERAKARGISEQDYMAGNLLGREVKAEDVAQAFLDQALALKTTASVTTVDGGNIEAILR